MRPQEDACMMAGARCCSAAGGVALAVCVGAYCRVLLPLLCGMVNSGKFQTCKYNTGIIITEVKLCNIQSPIAPEHRGLEASTVTTMHLTTWN